MDINLPNAAPQHIALGVNDGSGRVVPIAPQAIPTHLPKIWMFASQGTDKEVTVAGDGLTQLFGDATFDPNQPFFNHATEFAMKMTQSANLLRVKRVIPDDAGPRATLRFWLDVLVGEVPVFERNIDGSIVLDELGRPKKTGEVIPNGHSVAVIAEFIPPGAQGVSMFGKGAIRAGFQTDAVTGTQSQQYPILDQQARDVGEYAHNHGTRMFTPSLQDVQGVDVGILQNEKAYPVRFQMIRREDADSVGQVFSTPAGSQYLDLVFKPNTKDRRYGNMKISVADQLTSAWEQVAAPGIVERPGLFGSHHVYAANVDTLVKQFYAAEFPHRDEFTDFTGEENEEYRFNFIGGFSSSGVLYHSFVINSELPEAHHLNENSVAYAGGSSNGTMTNASFAALVSREVSKYADVYSDLMDDARHVESIVYDTGFPLQTKYDLLKFQAVRKDTMVILSTYDVDGADLTAEQESSMGLTLRTMAMMYPESIQFGTKTCRVAIVMGSGRLAGAQDDRRYPVTFELGIKLANFMGAANGVWNSLARPDYSPGSIVNSMYDLSTGYMPVPVRYKNWDNGQIWVQAYDTERYHFPQMQTVYPDDTSIVNHVITAMVVVELQKIGARLTRYYQGGLLTNEEIKQKTEVKFSEWTAGKFNDMYRVIPETIITGLDELRGYSWFTNCQLYGPNSKTVGQFAIEALRIDDLATTNIN